MPRTAKPLTNTEIEHAIRRTEGKSKKGRSFPLWDGQGLHLINRAERYHWRLKYVRPDGRENRLALGPYPFVSLAEARAAAGNARHQIRQGIDPAACRKAEKLEAERAITATFAKFAEQWLAIKSPGWAESTRRKQELVVNGYLIPTLGKRDVRDIVSREVVAVLRKMDTDTPALARKAAGAAQAIVRLAISEGIREDGRLLDLNLRDNLPAQHKGHFPAATSVSDVAAMMRTLNAMRSEVTRSALLMCAYTAQRPGNVAAMRWADVDLKHAEWIIPAPAMKTRHDHVVPLSRQALTLIESMRAYTAGREYVFPPLARQQTPHLHRDSLSNALREAGLAGKQTPHGLRATMRTVARERLGVSADVLEAQLAHVKRGEVQAAYDRTGFIEERHRAMQAWADYLDNTQHDSVTRPARKN